MAKSQKPKPIIVAKNGSSPNKVNKGSKKRKLQKGALEQQSILKQNETARVKIKKGSKKFRLEKSTFEEQSDTNQKEAAHVKKKKVSKKLRLGKCTLQESITNQKEDTQVTSSLQEEKNIDSLDTTNFEEGVRVLYEVFAKTKETHPRTQLLDDNEEPIYLQISAIKIPKCRDHIERIVLPHSYHPKDIEICLISADLPNTNLLDYDKVTELYENILIAHGISNIKTVMSYHQLRKEFQEFEMKRKLSFAYNLFLADSKIHGNVVHFLGRCFSKPHKTPRVVSFDRPNIKKQVERIISQTDLKIHDKGDSSSIKVGIMGMPKEHVLDNVRAVANKLSDIYPGGCANIRSISIKNRHNMAVPLYLTLKMKSEVEIPVLQAPVPKKNISYTDDLSTLLNTKVTVYPSGHVKTSLIEKFKKRSKQHLITPDNDQDFSNATDSENDNLTLAAKEESDNSIQLEDSDKESDSNVEDEIMSDQVDDKIVKSAKRGNSKSKKSPEVLRTEERVPEIRTPKLKNAIKVIQEKMQKRSPASIMKYSNSFVLSTSKATPKSKVAKNAQKSSESTAPNIDEVVAKTPDVKRKSSFANTGSQKKQKLIKNPYFNGNTSE